MFLFLQNRFKKASKLNSTPTLEEKIKILTQEFLALDKNTKEAKEIYKKILDNYKMLLYLREDIYTKEYTEVLILGANSFKDKGLLKKAQEFLDFSYILNKNELNQKIKEIQKAI